jgi:hypothetical protein
MASIVLEIGVVPEHGIWKLRQSSALGSSTSTEASDWCCGVEIPAKQVKEHFAACGVGCGLAQDAGTMLVQNLNGFFYGVICLVLVVEDVPWFDF